MAEFGHRIHLATCQAVLQENAHHAGGDAQSCTKQILDYVSALAKLGHLRHTPHLKDTPERGESDDGWDTVDFTANGMVEKRGLQMREFLDLVHASLLHAGIGTQVKQGCVRNFHGVQSPHCFVCA